MKNDYFRTSRVKRHPLGFGIILGVILVILFAIVSGVHQKFVGYVSDNPSPFYASLSTQPLFWHRWTPHSFKTLGFLWFTVFLGLMFLHSYVAKTKAQDRVVFGSGVIFTLIYAAALFYNFHSGGFALYGNRFTVSAPFRDLSPQTYDIKDIERIEVGCRIMCFGGHRCSDGGATAVYDVHLKNGRSYPLYQAALDDFDDPALIEAIAVFDSHVRDADIPRSYKMNILSEPMSTHVCYTRMQEYAGGDSLKRLLRASRVP
jgi:hypothetical protein